MLHGQSHQSLETSTKTALEAMLSGVQRVSIHESCEVFESADPVGQFHNFLILPSSLPMVRRQEIAAICFEAAEAWRLADEHGRKIGRAAETSSWLDRHVCGSAERARTLHVWAVGTANPEQPLLRFVKRFALPPSCGCCCGWCQCCCCCRLQALSVYGFDAVRDQHSAAVGDRQFDCSHDLRHAGEMVTEQILLGSIQQVGCRPGCCGLGPRFKITDANGQELFTLDGPCWHCEGTCCDVSLEVRSLGEAVGELSRGRNTGEALGPRVTTVAHTGLWTSLWMPARAPATPHRALLLGALYLVETCFFGQSSSSSQFLHPLKSSASIHPL
eukprot:SAG31_NODE_2859_length_4990_cov_113.128399_2_plen_330_part_00